MKEDLFYIEIGKRIKTERKKRNIDQNQLSKLLCLSRVSISNIEAGRQRISIYDLFKISNYFKTDIENLLPDNKINIEDFKIIGLQKDDPNYQSTLTEIKRFMQSI